MKNLLILSFTNDPHVQAVCSHIDSGFGNYFLLNTNEIPRRYAISFNSCDLVYTISDKEKKKIVTIGPSWNIWNRRIIDPDLPQDISDGLVRIVSDETKRTIEGMMFAHQGRIINDPRNEYQARNKLNQLALAQSLNLNVKIPSTLVTNDVERLKAFYATYDGKICFKLQKGAIVDGGDKKLTILTSLIGLEHLSQEELIQQCPHLFQQYIDKEYEARIVVIGEEVLGVAIHSQDSEISRIDYRRYDFNIPYKALELPTNVKEFCLSMTKHYGLHFGAFDFIVTKKEKNFVFLELNPNGQWLWLEQLSGFPISKSLASYLTS